MKACLASIVGAIALLQATVVHARPADAPVDPSIPIALLVDISSGQTLYARNPERRFVPASVTKAMTAFTAFDLIARGKLSQDTTYAFSEAAAEDWEGVGSRMFLRAGDEARVADLLKAITTVSANDGSVVLAEGAAGSVEKWLKLMNANARVLGMRQSHFGTPNGWPDDGATFTTARDLIRLGRAMVTRHPALYAQYFGHRGMVTNGIAQDNHDPITGRVEGADGIKTGFTRQAGNNFFGSAIRDGRRLMMVLAGAPEGEVRDESARELIEWGFDAFVSRQLFARGDTAGDARVQDGAAARVKLLAEEDITFVAPAGGQPAVKLSIRYEGPLRAPIKAGERVAQLQISVEGMQPSLVPLVAARDVERAGFLRRMANAFTGLFS